MRLTSLLQGMILGMSICHQTLCGFGNSKPSFGYVVDVFLCYFISGNFVTYYLLKVSEISVLKESSECVVAARSR